MKTIVKRVTAIVCLAILSGCAAAWPKTELFAGVPQPDGPGSDSVYPADRPTNVMLRNRVQERFPVGSDEHVLVAWLNDQKVEIRRYSRNDGGTRGRAIRSLGTWPCDRTVRVFWESSADQQIESITADEGGSGCF